LHLWITTDRALLRRSLVTAETMVSIARVKDLVKESFVQWKRENGCNGYVKKS